MTFRSSKALIIEYVKFLLMLESIFNKKQPSQQIQISRDILHIWNIHKSFIKQYKYTCTSLFHRDSVRVEADLKKIIRLGPT
jgi:hypothetical protein